jgi:hypothetical protein
MVIIDGEDKPGLTWDLQQQRIWDEDKEKTPAKQEET